MLCYFNMNLILNAVYDDSSKYNSVCLKNSKIKYKDISFAMQRKSDF